MSIAGGCHNAVLAAQRAGCDTLQIFTKNNNQWRAKELRDEDVRLFREHLAAAGIKHPTAHASYLINLASPDPTLWKKSCDAMVVELTRSERLGLDYLVVHPGSHMQSSVEQGLQRVAQALNEVHRRTSGFRVRILLEITAGQGTNLGFRFEQLAAIIAAADDPERLGVCFDTCHAFAAGYAMGTEREYRATMRAFGRVIGWKKLKVFHLNDSKAGFGSRVDRHAHIGKGQLGLEPFRFILNDRRFRRVPMILETPKQGEKGEEMDRVNLRTLRRLVQQER